MVLSRAILGLLVLCLISAPLQAAELVMFESKVCAYCAEWHRTIGPIYPKTAEGKLAPLRRVDIHEPRPGDLAAIAPVVYTPTFVLVENQREIGRMEGYANDDFFWGLLGQQIAKLKQK
jgi:thioredoxin-related protein